MPTIKENLIINQLIVNTEFKNRALPYLKEEYFNNQISKILFETVKTYIEKYLVPPSKEALLICLKPKITHFSEDNLKELSDIMDDEIYNITSIHNEEWLLDTTEEFCKNQSIYNAIVQSIDIYEGNKKDVQKEIIPDLLKEALAVSFDSKIGIDYADEFNLQYQFYQRKEYGITFDIPILNSITNQVGLPRKALTVLVSSTGGGKTLAKCHFAASAIKQGFNVLYFTMEMAQERIAQRIDANLLEMDHNDIPYLSEEDYTKKTNKIKKLCKGKLIIKEFPTGSATSNHFKHIIEELKRKKNINIDLMIVDYLNICSSSRYKATNGINTYTILKSVAEEIRSLGMEYDMSVLSSAQVNRGNMNNQDMGLDGISESMGITHTADLVLYLFRNEQLDQVNRILITQLKNRYDDLTRMKRFLVGVNRGQMKLYEVDSNETAVFLGSSGSNDPHEPTPEVNTDHFKGRSQIASGKSFSDFKY